MRISFASIPVADQEHALRFYTEVLGFVKKVDIPIGTAKWLTVVSPDDQDGTELVLEPNADYPAMAQLKADLVRDGIPFNAFQVDDIHAEHARLTALGVKFTVAPTDAGEVTMAVFDDTCGNLLQIFQTK